MQFPLTKKWNEKHTAHISWVHACTTQYGFAWKTVMMVIHIQQILTDPLQCEQVTHKILLISIISI